MNMWHVWHDHITNQIGRELKEHDIIIPNEARFISLQTYIKLVEVIDHIIKNSDKPLTAKEIMGRDEIKEILNIES